MKNDKKTEKLYEAMTRLDPELLNEHFAHRAQLEADAPAAPRVHAARRIIAISAAAALAIAALVIAIIAFRAPVQPDVYVPTAINDSSASDNIATKQTGENSGSITTESNQLINDTQSNEPHNETLPSTETSLPEDPPSSDSTDPAEVSLVDSHSPAESSNPEDDNQSEVWLADPSEPGHEESRPPKQQVEPSASLTFDGIDELLSFSAKTEFSDIDFDEFISEHPEGCEYSKDHLQIIAAKIAKCRLPDEDLFKSRIEGFGATYHSDRNELDAIYVVNGVRSRFIYSFDKLIHSYEGEPVAACVFDGSEFDIYAGDGCYIGTVSADYATIRIIVYGSTPSVFDYLKRSAD